MNTRANQRRAEDEVDNGGVPPQGVQGGQALLGAKRMWCLSVGDGMGRCPYIAQRYCLRVTEGGGPRQEGAYYVDVHEFYQMA
uniref:Uncharacterized protein n=1 Tax=Solanum tuberosum TaxID=4113 RepID=M1DEQ6_SOLTU